MAGSRYTSPSSPISLKQFGGGLNSTSGQLSLKDNESSSLQNIDFNVFGSIFKRNGYTTLNTSAYNSGARWTGLKWFEKSDGNRFLVGTCGNRFVSASSLSQAANPYTNLTGALTITAGNLTDFEVYLDTVMGTNGTNPPFSWDGAAGSASAMTVPTNLTKAKYIKTFYGYTFLASVTVSGTDYKSRVYWSNLDSITTWTDSDNSTVGYGDGQEITGLKVLGDRLIIFKTRSIWFATFTGDPDIPFLFIRTNSVVGCSSHFTIKEINNGLVFASFDGDYFFDGNNSYKISDRITTTIQSLNSTQFSNSCAAYQRSKNRYWRSVTSSGGSTNNQVLTWDSVLEAYSIYSGIAASCFAEVYSSGTDELLYFGDYSGYVYKADTGSDDYPLNIQTAINAYYYTKWFDYEDLVNQKGTPHCFIYYRTSNARLTHSYSYDFEEADQYSTSFNTSSGTAVYGTAVYDTSTYAGSTGFFKKRDLVGRGRVIRHKFSNSNLSETFGIVGFGAEAYLDTNV